MCKLKIIIKIFTSTLFLFNFHVIASEEKNPFSEQWLNEIKQLAEIEVLQRTIPFQDGTELTYSMPVEGSTNKAINLGQGWTKKTQQQFYSTSQGSRIMPYDWYLYLEQVNSTSLFRANDNISSYGYIPSNIIKGINPDGLSIGFVKDTPSATTTTTKSQIYPGMANGAWVGMNCAACHTTEVEYKGTVMRIDGGPTMANFQQFNVDLVTALESTIRDDDKFERFAKNVLQTSNYIDSTDNKDRLKLDLIKQTDKLNHRNKINVPNDHQAPYGYGRLDAIGAIFNQVLSVFNNDPHNARVANAPVSYPFLWGTHQSDVVQWTGFAPNGPLSLGALIRNGGEVLGVYGQIEIDKDTNTVAYPSSLDFKGLGILEARVAQLKAPPWPQKLSSIDASKSQQGKSIYAKECASCHAVVAKSDQGKPYKAQLTPLSDVKTDAQEIINLLAYRDSGAFNSRHEFGKLGPQIGTITTGLDPLVNSVVGTIIAQIKEAMPASFVEYEGGKLASNQALNNGIGLDKKQRYAYAKKAMKDLDDFKQAYKDLIATAQFINSKCKLTPKLCKELLDSGLVVVDVKDYINNLQTTPEQKAIKAAVRNGQVYKARPLNGIWATAPYLHNGSVLSLMELLKPEEKRLKEFYVGSRKLDTVNVGFINEQVPHSSLFDTKLLGNSNRGHTYGVDLKQDDKIALVEYMKTL
ncbi:di-heme-cytochrome C peroxidase [Photobacterium makurazakiensis]|uniref:di-heme-cytochrome C peroxidase n=1 Tax=Photobacterium makurazakiensis TaxID=2910234 RepID=UPI003D115A26